MQKKLTRAKVGKPWGYEDRWAITERYLGKILHIEPGQRLSLQYHEKKDESVYVLDGVLIIEHKELEDEKLKHMVLEKGDTYRIKPLTVHRFSAPDLSHATLIEVSTGEINDVVRLEDDYGRVNNGQ